MRKNSWRYHHFTQVYQKSYDVQFLRYRVRKAKKFVILGHFLPFYPPNNQENQNKKKMKKKNEKKKMKKASVRCHHFTHVYQKLQSYDRAVSRI